MDVPICFIIDVYIIVIFLENWDQTRAKLKIYIYILIHEFNINLSLISFIPIPIIGSKHSLISPLIPIPSFFSFPIHHPKLSNETS